MQNHIHTPNPPPPLRYDPFVTPTYTPSIQLHPDTHQVITPGFVDRPRRSDCTPGQMDGEAGWWTISRKFPPAARVMEWVDNNTCTGVFNVMC